MKCYDLEKKWHVFIFAVAENFTSRDRISSKKRPNFPSRQGELGPTYMKRIIHSAQFTARRSKIRLETGLLSVITAVIHIAFVDR